MGDIMDSPPSLGDGSSLDFGPDPERLETWIQEAEIAPQVEASVEDASPEDVSPEDASPEDVYPEDASMEGESLEDDSLEDESLGDGSRDAPSRKRRLASDDGSDEHRPKRPLLTRENLARLAKTTRKPTQTGPASASTAPDSAVFWSPSKSAVIARVRRNGILRPQDSLPPVNLASILERHMRSRQSATPPESLYLAYVNRVDRAGNMPTMVHEVTRHMMEEYDDDAGYKKAFNRAFTAFPEDVGFNDCLSTPQPGFVEGLEADEFRPVRAIWRIAGAVVYKDDPYSITLPHLAGEWKGPAGNMAGATMQCGYSGAALVYARNEALFSMGKRDPLGHSEITTFATNGTTINFYAHHFTVRDGWPEYHQYRYASENVTDTYEGYLDGRRGLRNAQDYAREQSYALKDQLRRHWDQRRCNSHIIVAQDFPPARRHIATRRLRGRRASL